MFDFSSVNSLKLGKKWKLFVSGARQPPTLKPLKISLHKDITLLHLPKRFRLRQLTRVPVEMTVQKVTDRVPRLLLELG